MRNFELYPVRVISDDDRIYAEAEKPFSSALKAPLLPYGSLMISL